jgi:putative membrane protein
MYPWHMGWGWYWWLWTLLWLAFAVVVIVLIARAAARPTGARRQEDALDILNRRYAAGEITTEEYEDRKSRLLR